jgi:hypothetical protein
MVAHIPPDISYGLECSVECFDTTSDVSTYYYRFNEVNLAALVDERETFDRDDVNESLRSLSRLYMRPYDDWFYTQASLEERTWCVASASRSFGRKSAEIIDSMVTRYVSDMLSSGLDPLTRRSQEEWLDRSRMMTHAGKLAAKVAHKIAVVGEEEVLSAIRRPAAYFERLPVLPQPPRPTVLRGPDGEPIWTDLEPVDQVLGGFETHGHPLLGRSYTAGQRAKLVAKARRKHQSVLKKSSAFLSRLIGTNNVTMFVGGKSIRVEGQRFVFELKKANILAENHGALSISVLDKESDRRLFDLCWYVERTPALDQISALVMAVRAGEEDEIIRVGNMFSIDHVVCDSVPHLNLAIPERSFGGGILGAAGGEDGMMHVFPGTTEYHRSHPDLYQSFARRCAARMHPRRFPVSLREYFRPHAPETIRPFGDRVGRELLPDRYEPVLPAIEEEPMRVRLDIVDRVIQQQGVEMA